MTILLIILRMIVLLVILQLIIILIILLIIAPGGREADGRGGGQQVASPAEATASRFCFCSDAQQREFLGFLSHSRALRPSHFKLGHHITPHNFVPKRPQSERGSTDLSYSTAHTESGSRVCPWVCQSCGRERTIRTYPDFERV